MELRALVREPNHPQHHHHLHHHTHHHRDDAAIILPSSDEEHARHSQPEKPPTHKTESHDFKISIETKEEAEDRSHVIRPMYILGIPIHKLSPVMQLAVCVCGVLFFYLLYGYSQEWIFRVKGFKQYGWYLTLVQFAFYSIFGTVERTIHGESGRRIPLSMYMLIALLTVATMGLSNTSLGYLNYPTQVIFKSCKLVPVMIGGILIQGKRYSVMNGVAVVCMSVGLVLFNLADLSIQPSMDQTGVLLISLALCADAMIGNLQEKALRRHSASNLEMILYSYSIGVLYIFAWVTITGSLLPAFQFCMKNPKIYLMIAVFSLTGYLGINFVLALVRTYGALLAVTVTTFRKTITIILSFLVFTKPFTQQYVWSGLLVLVGILLNVYSKNSRTVDKFLHLTYLRLCYMLCRGKRTYTTKQFSV